MEVNSKVLWKSWAWWTNMITLTVFILTPMPVASTLLGSFVLYVLNLIVVKTSSGANITAPSFPLPTGITMKGLMIFVNIAGIITDAVTYGMTLLSSHGIEYTPPGWVAYVISGLTIIVRVFTQPKKLNAVGGI